MAACGAIWHTTDNLLERPETIVMNPDLSVFAHGSAATQSQTPPDDVVPTDDETIRVALKAYVRLATLWTLTDREAAALLELTTRTWQRIKREQWNGERLTKDQLLRIGTLAGIHQTLPRCFGPEIALAWPKLANASAPFVGRSPLQYMIDGALPALMNVRRRVEAMAEGA